MTKHLRSSLNEHFKKGTLGVQKGEQKVFVFTPENITGISQPCVFPFYLRVETLRFEDERTSLDEYSFISRMILHSVDVFKGFVAYSLKSDGTLWTI